MKKVIVCLFLLALAIIFISCNKQTSDDTVTDNDLQADTQIDTQIDTEADTPNDTQADTEVDTQPEISTDDKSKPVIHTVTFDLNGGTGEIKSQLVHPNECVKEVNIPTKEGHIFVGWFYNDEIWKINRYGVNYDITLTAKWSKDIFEISDYDTIKGLKAGFEDIDTIEIPPYHNGLAITGIEANAFKGNEAIKNVILPNTIITIGHSAFEGCKGLESINLPSSVTYLGNEIFKNCYYLKELNYDIKRIDKHNYGIVFYNAGIYGTGITINVGSDVEEIPSNLFKGDYISDQNPWNSNNNEKIAPNFKALKFAENSVCTKIGEKAFYKNKFLRNVELPNSIRTLEASCFYGCTGIKEISIPPQLENVEYSVFEKCTSLERVIFPPQSVSSKKIKIGKNMFNECTAIKEINVNNNQVEFGSYTFYNCSNLTKVDLCL